MLAPSIANEVADAGISHFSWANATPVGSYDVEIERCERF